MTDSPSRGPCAEGSRIRQQGPHGPVPIPPSRLADGMPQQGRGDRTDDDAATKFPGMFPCRRRPRGRGSVPGPAVRLSSNGSWKSGSTGNGPSQAGGSEPVSSCRQNEVIARGLGEIGGEHAGTAVRPADRHNCTMTGPDPGAASRVRASRWRIPGPRNAAGSPLWRIRARRSESRYLPSGPRIGYPRLSNSTSASGEEAGETGKDRPCTRHEGHGMGRQSRGRALPSLRVMLDDLEETDCCFMIRTALPMQDSAPFHQDTRFRSPYAEVTGRTDHEP